MHFYVIYVIKKEKEKQWVNGNGESKYSLVGITFGKKCINKGDRGSKKLVYGWGK